MFGPNASRGGVRSAQVTLSLSENDLQEKSHTATEFIVYHDPVELAKRDNFFFAVFIFGMSGDTC
jgi:hypothetical protein